MTVTGTADPVELRHLAEAWPEDIFPTPPDDLQAKDAAAAHVLRRMAVPHFLACADEIERLHDALVDVSVMLDHARFAEARDLVGRMLA